MPTHHPAATARSHGRLQRYELTKKTIPMVPAPTALNHPCRMSPATMTATENVVRKMPQPYQSIRSASAMGGRLAGGSDPNKRASSGRSEYSHARPMQAAHSQFGSIRHHPLMVA